MLLITTYKAGFRANSSFHNERFLFRTSPFALCCVYKNKFLVKLGLTTYGLLCSILKRFFNDYSVKHLKQKSKLRALIFNHRRSFKQSKYIFRDLSQDEENCNRPFKWHTLDTNNVEIILDFICLNEKLNFSLQCEFVFCNHEQSATS